MTAPTLLPARIVSAKPVELPASRRGSDLLVRVSAPQTGSDLPVVVLSHGFGWSLDSYDPLVDHWAAHGFVVVQPTHLDSRSLGLTPDDPRFPDVWRHRVDDLTAVLDRLDLVEAAVPGLAGRLDAGRIAVAGHSWGGQTASTLLGARVLDASGEPGEDLSDARVRTGVLLSTPGSGGPDLTPFAAENLPFMHPGFATMTTPALVVAGAEDRSPLSTRGPDWFTDAYALSPPGKSLLTLTGAEHSLGGIAGRGLAETTDDSAERVAVVQRLTCAYLRTALGVDQTSWPQSVAALHASPERLGRVVSR